MSNEQAKQILADYYAGTVTVQDAAKQLADIVGNDPQVQDERLTALQDELQVLTTLPCVITTTAATSCSRWCD